MKIQLSFKFHQHQDHLTEIFNKIFAERSFCDIRLIGDDCIPVEAHRIVLSAFSNVIEKKILEKQEGDEIKIQGMNQQDLESILQFMYLGQVSVPHSRVEGFLRRAKFLGIRQIMDQCNVDMKELNNEHSMTFRAKIAKSSLSEEYLNTTNESDDDIRKEDNLNSTISEIEESFVIKLNECLTDIDESRESLTSEEYFNTIKSGINDDNGEEEDFSEMEDEDVECSNEVQEKDRADNEAPKDISPQMKNESDALDHENDVCVGITIGAPDSKRSKNDRQSILFTNNYFRKLMVSRENGRKVPFAKCLMCLKEGQEKRHFNITGSTKGIIDHLKNFHENYYDLYIKQRQKRRKPRFNIKMNDNYVGKESESTNIILEEEEVIIGEPKPGIGHKDSDSVFYTHNFYKKIIDNDIAMCLMCLRPPNRMQKFVKITRGNTKGLLCHLKTAHDEYLEKYENLQSRVLAIREEKRKLSLEFKKNIFTDRKIPKSFSKLQVNEFKIERSDFLNVSLGDAEPGFNPHASVFFSHNYFRKVSLNGNEGALCLLCWKLRGEKTILKATCGNTKSMQSHTVARHPDFVEKIMDQNKQIVMLRSKRKDQQQLEQKQKKEMKAAKKRLKKLQEEELLQMMDDEKHFNL